MAEALEPDCPPRHRKYPPGSLLKWFHIYDNPRGEKKIPPHKFELYCGTVLGNQRSSRVYLAIGLPLVLASILGFIPSIFWRLSTGTWWRDPVLMRKLPFPASVDKYVSLHGFVGILWTLLVTVQLISGAACSGDATGSFCPLRTRLRSVHRWLGQRSLLVTLLFFLTCFLSWISLLLSEPIGGSFNSVFVRAEQATSGTCSFLLYMLGMYYATHNHVAAHKDCMIASILFATVPIGVPRFLRDLLQLFVGDGCNVADKPEFNFFVCSIYAVFSWPMLYKLARRWDQSSAQWFKLNILVVLLFIAFCQPDLHPNPCFLQR